jgi:CspA family cold shock protein
MQIGIVKWYNKTKGYGFVSVEGVEGDVLVHQSSIQMEGFRFLTKSALVVVNQVIQTDQGLRAAEVLPLTNQDKFK